MQTSRFPRAVLRFMWIFKKRPKPCNQEIQDYLAYRNQKNFITGYDDIEAIEGVYEWVKKASVSDFEYQEVKTYIDHIYDHRRTIGSFLHSLKSVRVFLGFHKEKIKFDYRLVQENMKEIPLNNAIKNDSIKSMAQEEKIKKKRGRPPNIEMIKRIKFLADEGKLGLRQIERAFNNKYDYKTINSWYYYDLSKLDGIK